MLQIEIATHVIKYVVVDGTEQGMTQQLIWLKKMIKLYIQFEFLIQPRISYYNPNLLEKKKSQGLQLTDVRKGQTLQVKNVKSNNHLDNYISITLKNKAFLTAGELQSTRLDRG